MEDGKTSAAHPNVPVPAVRSEVDSQCELAGAIASIALGQSGLQDPEVRGVADVHRGWSVIGVVQNIREGRFEAQPEPLLYSEHLGQTRVHVDHAGTLQDTYAAAPKPPGVGRR